MRNQLKNTINVKHIENATFKNDGALQFHKSLNICYIHSEECESRKFQKVKYYFDLTRKCRGAIHFISSFRYALPREDPIIICDASSYDFYLIIKRFFR